MDRASGGYVPAAHLALTAQAAGEHENAMAFARHAWDEREPPSFFGSATFRGTAYCTRIRRFAAILREIGSPEEHVEGGY